MDPRSFPGRTTARIAGVREKSLIESALEQANGVQAEAAQNAAALLPAHLTLLLLLFRKFAYMIFRCRSSSKLAGGSAYHL